MRYNVIKNSMSRTGLTPVLHSAAHNLENTGLYSPEAPGMFRGLGVALPSPTSRLAPRSQSVPICILASV